MFGKWKKLFKEDIGSCTEAKFMVSDWGDTMNNSAENAAKQQ
jgi:hypothetical protein